MKKRLLAVLVAIVAAGTASAAPAQAHSTRRVDVNRTSYSATGVSGHPELRRGGVLDVTFGRNHGAFELHYVGGAAPNTDYVVNAEIFFAQNCEGDAFPFEEGILETNAVGNGRFTIRFDGDTFDTAPDTFWVRWQLLAGNVAAYQSGCVQVDLGP